MKLLHQIYKTGSNTDKMFKKIIPRKYLHYYLFTKISKINCSKDFVKKTSLVRKE